MEGNGNPSSKIKTYRNFVLFNECRKILTLDTNRKYILAACVKNQIVITGKTQIQFIFLHHQKKRNNGRKLNQSNNSRKNLK